MAAVYRETGKTSFKREGEKKRRGRAVHLIVLNVGLKYRIQSATIAESASVVLSTEIVFRASPLQKRDAQPLPGRNILKGRHLKSRVSKKNRQSEETCDTHQLQRQKQHNTACTT